MCKTKVTSFIAGVVLALATAAGILAQSPQARPQSACKSAPPESQSVSPVDEMIARAEDRVDALREKLFDLEIKEMDLRARLEDMDYRLTPDGIQRALAFIGSPRPMDEFRDALRARLEGQQARVIKQLEQLLSTRERLESEMREAEAELEKVRQR